ELWTYYPAKLKTAVDTWNFFMRGNDLHTPLASLAVRAATALFGNNELGIRIRFTLLFARLRRGRHDVPAHRVHLLLRNGSSALRNCFGIFSGCHPVLAPR